MPCPLYATINKIKNIYLANFAINNLQILELKFMTFGDFSDMLFALLSGNLG